MTNDDDPLDHGDGEFDDVEMFLWDEDRKQISNEGNKASGCCIAFIFLGAPVSLSILDIARIFFVK